MKSFHQFWDRINGEMYKSVPLPVKYKMNNYLNGLTSGPLNGSEENSSYELRPLSQEDMASYARPDVEEWYAKYGQNTTRLGKEMTDAEFKRFYGHTW
jgi:hypothetical protein